MTATQKSLTGFRSPLSLSPARGDVLLALSGGADSVSLLYCLVADAKEKGYRIAAAHVHHGIRAKEADADEDFCRKLCATLAVPFFCHRADVPTMARTRGQNLEECARDVRYAYFEELMRAEGFSILATAHHADDQLETLLLHLTRGASSDGLCGMRPVRPFGDGYLVRPLLDVTRAQIQDFCVSRHIVYVTDSTNADTSYARNRLRADVCPVLRELNPRLSEAVTRLCADACRDADYLRELTDRFLAEHQTKDGIDIKALQSAPLAIATRAICHSFLLASEGIALSHHHTEAILALVRSSDPRASYDLPRKLCAKKEAGRLRFCERIAPCEPVFYEQKLHEGINVISHTGFEIFMETSQSPKNVYKKSIRLYLNPDTIIGELYARPRRAGDVILCGGMHKDVRKLLGAHRVPMAMRDSLPMICDGDGIVAIPNVAVRDGAKATEEKAITLDVTYP